MTDNKPGFTIYGEPIRGRSCGSCKLCCTLLPVELETSKKPANVKCQHVCSKGCSIYENRPAPCRYFNCRWLFDKHADNLRRPDKTGYVIDPMLDGILADEKAMDVIQVWVDPERRDAHRDPELREYLSRMFDIYRLPAIIRWSSTKAMFLIPPQATKEGEWMEIGGDHMNMKTEIEMKALYNQAVQEEIKDG